MQIVVDDAEEEEGGTLRIKPGILKHRGRLYHMVEECLVPYEASEKWMMLKLKFFEVNETSDYTTYQTKILLDEDMELQVDEIELCRFLLKAGARLRQDYQDIRDFDTEHNTVNRIHVQYAGISVTTISPEITAYFGRELLGYHNTNPYDIGFAMNCIQQTVISRSVIMQYLHIRQNVKLEEKLSNKQIHTYLVMILEEIKAGKLAGNSGERLGRRVIVE
ncbi:hypothetical protein [Anaerosporobacter sp.]|uniref:hypothetical protein n=1 Tax=Anaerosporobacter sp. TaxID=1872529 RepID=UPI00286F7E46|nr:hypothetical protein [Anaerosporobacter sp.]